MKGVYFYWKCFWDVEKAMDALCRQYGLDLVRQHDNGWEEPLHTLVERAYKDAKGSCVHDSGLTQRFVRDNVRDYIDRAIVPECVQHEVYVHAVEQRTPGFDIIELMGEFPCPNGQIIIRPVSASAVIAL